MTQLRTFCEKDFGLLSSWFASEEEVVQWGGPLVRYPLDQTQMQSMLKETIGTRPVRKCWMAELEGETVGHVQLSFDWRNGNATVGRVIIAPNHRGKRLAAPMLRLVLEQAFGVAEVYRVELNVYTFNQPAIRTYLSLGFKAEGTRRQAALVGEKRWDVCGMAILRPDFEGTRSA
jgi:RimJ/RimL family protein N-acetyltransferase